MLSRLMCSPRNAGRGPLPSFALTIFLISHNRIVRSREAVATKCGYCGCTSYSQLTQSVREISRRDGSPLKPPIFFSDICQTDVAEEDALVSCRPTCPSSREKYTTFGDKGSISRPDRGSSTSWSSGPYSSLDTDVARSSNRIEESYEQVRRWDGLFGEN